MDDLLSPLPLGIAIGLVLGKPVGIVAAAVLMRVAGFASFPRGMDFRAMLGLGMLCGIGFTMSLFIGSLAFSREPLLYTESVIGVLVARSEEHTSELQSLMRISYAVFCLKKKTQI